ncbi:hypothetical protein [Oceanobacillus kapialis]|uniref:Uncharacterized protein n=1 Tax=Oceanobacillus kapialis TaxID=481353 RepID=A0ABW5PVZ1_9BACI
MGECLSPCRPEAFPVVEKQVKQRKGGIIVYYHLDMYKGITNDRMNHIRKETYENNTVIKANGVIDWKLNTSMLIILIFRSGKG